MNNKSLLNTSASAEPVTREACLALQTKGLHLLASGLPLEALAAELCEGVSELVRHASCSVAAWFPCGRMWHVGGARLHATLFATERPVELFQRDAVNASTWPQGNQLLTDVRAAPRWRELQAATPELRAIRACWAHLIGPPEEPLGLLIITSPRAQAPSSGARALMSSVAPLMALALERHTLETRQRSMEHQLMERQRLESLGRLAGGVVHDFNNILTIIQSYTALLRDHFEPGDEALLDLDAVQDATDRATRLTGQLLSFSRHRPQQAGLLNLNDVIRQMNEMLLRLLGEDVIMTLDLDESLGYVQGDLAQLEQIVFNLVLNARHAMPTGGRLTVGTRLVRLSHAEGERERCAPGLYAAIVVEDSGHGMSPETLKRVFEPFYSTRERGTGLGLDTVLRIVNRSRGCVRVTSEPGRGSRFEVLLPHIAQEDAAPSALRPSTPQGELLGDETILVVEDDALVRRVTCRTLRKHGYQVLEASGAGEALLLCERHEGPIHMMITDIVMPMMNGYELIQRLKPMRPDMEVLCVSGNNQNAAPPADAARPTLLRKPFLTQTLLLKVRELL